MPKGGLRTSLAFTLSPTGPLGKAFQPTNGVFSPGLPLVSDDPQPVRVLDFAVGQNTILTPRQYEAFSFAELRSFANVELVRLAIETRKDQMERLSWCVRQIDGKPTADGQKRAAIAGKIFRRPDGVTPFATWLRLLLEDLLVLDAPAIERRRNRNGALIGLDVVPGDTIKLLVDETGRRPLSPVPAYQQIIKGRVWNDLTVDDLIYSPRNRRPHKLYGFGPVEQIIVSCTTAMRRQSRQLAWFSEGNTPPGLLNAPEGWSADQIRQFQDWFDSRLSGNDAERAKLIWGPSGAKYQAFKDPPIKDEFDEWLARVICYAFSLPPTPFIRQMNRATADTSDSTALEEGREPLMLWWKRVADSIIQDDLGFTDLEWAWDIPKEVDPEKEARVHDIYLKNGGMKLNEVRSDLGLEPVQHGDQPMIYTATGAMPLDAVFSRADAELSPGKPIHSAEDAASGQEAQKPNEEEE